MRRILIILLVLFAQNAAAQLVVQVPMTEGEKRKVDAFLGGKSPLEINDYVSPNFDSIAPIEHFIFRKAILLGGLKAVFDDYLVPNSIRARAEVFSGRLPCGGTAQWNIYFRDRLGDVFVSDPVIEQGDYQKGLYTTKERLRGLRLTKRTDLKALSAVSSDTWVIDWATLKDLPLKLLHSTSTRPSQFLMVQYGRADFTLQDFAATPDMSIEEQGVRLYPIPGVKIALDGTRHFLVSRHHPDGERIFAALQRGLQKMQKSGELRRILTESGFIHTGVANWSTLNPL